MGATSARRGGARLGAGWLAAGLLAAAAAGGAGPATAGAASHVIHACFGGFDGGELHLAAVGSCPHNETPLSWNKRGRPGHDGRDSTFALLLFDDDSGEATNDDEHKSKRTFWSWVSDAVPALRDALLLFGLGVLALSILMIPIGWVIARPKPWRLLWRLRLFRWLGPTLQILPFEDGATEPKLGAGFAVLTQARVGGGREGGSHLYLVTGEDPPGFALADLQGTPETQALAAALTLLRLTWRRRRLIVTGSLIPVDDRGAVAVALSLRRNSKYISDAEFWPSEPPPAHLTANCSNRVLAVAAAGWVEHVVVDETPGPRAYETFLSSDPRSWALFRAGSELSRMSFLDDAADHYEHALEIDRENIGALVDLAHLRRREGHYEGAMALATDAIDLLDKRDYGRRKSKYDDPDWYRAQIVLTTVQAEYAKHLSSSPKRGRRERAPAMRRKACRRARMVARAAMDTRDRLERVVGVEELERAERGAKIRRRARARAFWRRPCKPIPSAPAPGAPSGARLKGYATRLFQRWKFDTRAVELYSLLKTTFEPGALLLVAANCPERAQPPPQDLPAAPAEGSDEVRREEMNKDLRSWRQRVREQLESEWPLEPNPLIEYVGIVPLKSPRVLYNLACHYSGAAARQKKANVAKAYLDIALENLRQSISRSPPLERRGLLAHLETDQDMVALHDARWSAIRALWHLVPPYPDEDGAAAGQRSHGSSQRP